MKLPFGIQVNDTNEHTIMQKKVFIISVEVMIFTSHRVPQKIHENHGHHHYHPTTRDNPQDTLPQFNAWGVYMTFAT